MSGSDTGLATSAARRAAPCAKASPIRRSGDSPARAASPVSDRAAVKARRVMINGMLPDGACTPEETWQCCASLKPAIVAMPGRGAEPAREPQFRLIEAPSRASAARSSSSSTAASVAATLADRGGIGRAGRSWPVAARQRRLPQRQPADRVPAEEAVDPLQDDVGGMLDFQRHRALDPQHQRRRLLRAGPRPGAATGSSAARNGRRPRARRSRPSASPVRATAKPCLAKASANTSPSRTDSGFAEIGPGFAMGGL